MRDGPPRSVVADAASRIDAYPTSAPLPLDFLDYIKSSVLKPEPWAYPYQCLAAEDRVVRCTALQLDLNHDGQAEIVLWAVPTDQLPNVFTKKASGWSRIGYLQGTQWTPEDFDLKSALDGSQVKVESPKWDALTVDGTRFFVSDTQEHDGHRSLR